MNCKGLRVYGGAIRVQFWLWAFRLSRLEGFEFKVWGVGCSE